MSEHNKHIDDIFRDKLGDYAETPDASVWDNIESRLNENTPAPSDGDAKSGGSGAAGISTGRILLLLIAGAAFFFTAKWAIGTFRAKDAKSATGIVITKEESLPPTKDVPALQLPIESATKDAESAAALSSNNLKDKNNVAVSNNNSIASHKNNRSKKHKSNILNPIMNTEPGTITPGIPKNKRNQRPAPVNPEAIAPGTSIPSVTAAASFSPAIKTVVPEPEKLKTNEPPVTPELPAEKPQPRIKEEMAALFFNGTIHHFSTGDKPDVDYGNLDASGNLQRLIKSIKKKLAAGRLEAGIKGGLEAGVNKYSAVKLAISPYAQYTLGSKLSVLFQPGFKFGRLTNTNLIPAESFYNTTYAAVKADHIVTPATDSTQADGIIRRYYYSQTYDSLTIGYSTAKKTLFEFEIPVLLNYDITNKFSVYGGVNFNFSKTVRMQEGRLAFKGQTRSDSVIYSQTASTNPSPEAPAIDSIFKHSASPYNAYSSQLWQNPTTDPLKLGYMVGFSYKIKERIRIDLLMQQNISNTSYIINKDIRSIHAQPYFRLTVGYRIFKSDTRKK